MVSFWNQFLIGSVSLPQQNAPSTSPSLLAALNTYNVQKTTPPVVSDSIYPWQPQNNTFASTFMNSFTSPAQPQSYNQQVNLQARLNTERWVYGAFNSYGQHITDPR